jgi:hypothetical protein
MRCALASTRERPFAWRSETSPRCSCSVVTVIAFSGLRRSWLTIATSRSWCSPMTLASASAASARSRASSAAAFARRILAASQAKKVDTTRKLPSRYASYGSSDGWKNCA